MLKTALTVLAVASLPGQAMALSCMVPNMARTFNEKAAEKQVYILVEGQFTADLALSDLLRLPPARPGEQPPRQESRTVRASAQFTGQQLGATQSAPMNARVTLEVECFSPWCGSFPPVGTPLLTFLAQGSDGSLTLRSGLCPGSFLARPSAAQTATLRRCLGQGSCTEADMRAME